MTENLMMRHEAQYVKISGRVQKSLISAVEAFRIGEDHRGLDEFISLMNDLESMIEVGQILGAEALDYNKLAPVLEALSVCVGNRDITGMTDLLEFSLYPLAKEWTVDDGNDYCETT